MNFTTEKITQARNRAAMAEMVDIDSFLAALDDIEALVAKAKQRETRLREAIEFYANPDNWTREDWHKHYLSEIDMDEGNIARAAIDEMKGGE